MISKLYKKDQKGQLRFWSIECNYIDNTLEMEFGVVGGEIQEKTEEVEANSVRDEGDQLEQRFSTRVHNKIKKGYLENKEEAMTRDKVLNLLGHTNPMLAQRYERQKKAVDLEGSLLQFKYDGHRCLVTNEGGELIAYSKNGIRITTIKHILDTLEGKIPDGETIDGELYHHGTKLQTISSWVKKSQDMSKKLIYIIYDVVDEGFYPARYAFLEGLGLESPSYLAETSSDIDADALPLLYRDAREAGFEGLMVRLDNSGYEDGKRSKNLLKIKTNLDGSAAYDGEFVVVGIKPSKDGWARLECEIKTKYGMTTFMVSAHGTIEEKTEVFVNKHNYLGRTVKVEYADYTKSGKPFHPVALDWRDKENE